MPVGAGSIPGRHGSETGRPRARRRPSAGLPIVSALRIGPLSPSANCPRPDIEKSRVRFDDPDRAHLLAARGRQQSTIGRNARWAGISVGLLRPDPRPQTATDPAKRPGHKVGAVQVFGRAVADTEAYTSTGVHSGQNPLRRRAPERCPALGITAYTTEEFSLVSPSVVLILIVPLSTRSGPFRTFRY